jgi:hypothetical protein
MATTNHSRTKKLGLETLEKREVFAGNVAAFVDAAGVLQIQGDGAANTVEVSEISANVFRVRGYPTRDAYGLNTLPTTVGGATYRDFFVPADKVAIDLGAGNDLVHLHDAAMARFDINMGNGNDSAYVYGVTVYGSGPSANILMGGDTGGDDVRLQNCTFASDLMVATGDGNDFVSFDNVRVNRLLSVYAGNGFDRYSWLNSSANQIWVWDSFEGT